MGYHAPCHDALEGKASEVVKALGHTGTLHPLPHCCSEAGTLALSRPDISEAMRARKVDVMAALRAETPDVSCVLTNCPSCLQGLGRSRSTGLVARHLAVHLAKRQSGADWKKGFVRRAENAKAISF
ncbi:MAG: hypothetical protein IPN59_09325 [Holophaga sp.]|nr:hypothetical protein [Holophaga sp.]